MRFHFIKTYPNTWPIAAMCRVLRVTRSGYYAWLKRVPSFQAQHRQELTTEIRRIHDQSRQTYGSPRVHAALLAQGRKICVNTVPKMMQFHRMMAKKKRQYVPRTTDSQHADPIAANVST